MSIGDYSIGDAALGEALSETGITGDLAAVESGADVLSIIETPPYTPTVAIQWELSSAYTPTRVAIEWNIPDTYTPSAIAISWQTDETYIPSAIAITWDFGDSYTPGVAVRWSIPQASHYAAGAARWSVGASLDGVAISNITGQVLIDVEETSSGLCTLVFLPATGAVDPDDYEGQTLSVDFHGHDSDGVTLYSVRRYTGRVQRASYNPDTGELTLNATTDLQGRLEASARTDIDAAIGSAYWSEFVFDDTADGWQYALDRLSTRPAAMWIDPEGFFRVTDWATGSVDITFTDASRFADSLTITRARRRDLLNRVRINMDYRFAKLRQRNLAVRIAYPENFCTWLDQPVDALQRAQVETAATDGGWQLVGDITYDGFPASGGFYCDGFWRAWLVSGADLSGVCLGASWQASRRWVQTITETAVIEVTASDSIEAVGELGIAEDYGFEAEYDVRGWETTPFDGDLAGATANDAGDMVADADAITERARSDYEAAQVCAIAKAKTQILDRHRQNRVTFAPVYRPDLRLGKTVRINTPYLVATGKVAAYTERLNVDTGALELRVDLALSRHGGSGLASSDPLDPVTQPDAPAETLQEATLALGYYIGGASDSPAQSDAWRGFITNRQYPDDLSKLYEPALVVGYPAIEDAARNAVEISGTSTVDVAIPQDELTMSA